MTITHTGLDVRRIGGRIGAEIDGVDLTASLDERTVAELSAALLAHKVLVIEGDEAAHYTPTAA
jgi:taurine dioxygenase